MKKIIFTVLSVFILFYGCSQVNMISPTESITALGKVSINIDKVSAPVNVSYVVATLTKANADTLTGFMNLSTDTTAGIIFQNIAIGTWNLTILAEDINGTVLYNGQSSVTVSQGTTTNVSLTLNPVLNGTGNVVINVSWGTKQSYFVDYLNNPIYTKNATYGYSLGISQSKVLLENGIYKMWYTKIFNSGVANIWYAVSNDGINWYSTDSTAVLTVGAQNTWDGYSVSVGAVIKDGLTYKMYYNGVAANGGPCSIGLATSMDGVHWQKYSGPVLTASQNEGQAGASGIILKDNQYYLYYTMQNHPYCAISLATSSDGINWNKYSGNPVIKASTGWEGADIYSPSYIYDSGQFTLVYMNMNATGFGMAYSSDGINWQKDGSNPFFVPGNSTRHWTYNIAYPDIHKINNKYWVFYTGYFNGYGAIGLITK